MSTDPLDVLRGLRPTTSLDTVWTAAEQVALRERILADRSPAPRATRRRRRAALAGVLAVGLLALPGAATAVGSGMTPQAFFDAYDYWNDNPEGGVDPTTARRVATAPGPYGGTFSVLTSRNGDGLTCIGPVFETAASARAALPDDFEDGGSFCHTEPDSSPFGVSTVGVGASGVFWWAHAGDAVTGELRTSDGQTYPVVSAEGYLFGWYPLAHLPPAQVPTLTAYASDGSVVGRTPV